MMNVTLNRLTMASGRDIFPRHANVSASANARNMKDANTHLQEKRCRGSQERIIIDQP